MVFRIPVLIVLVVAALLAGASAASARSLSFIRDAEIESIIRDYAAPLFRAAGLPPESIQVHLVNDSALNAFVAGGLNMFINTGLLMRSEDPLQVIGVIAHETGHISGGHLSRTRDALEGASASAILATVLGTAAAIGTGRGDLGAAITMGGQEIGARRFLRYSRAQESAADQAATQFLDATGQSARGLLAFMEILGDQELLPESRQDPYVRTHPITQDRVRFLREHVDRSPHSGRPATPRQLAEHRRMVAKLVGFLTSPARTLRQYPESDRGLPARYARAVAYYRRPDLPRALAEIDSLLAEYPDDPYFHELKGQILYENGRVAESLPHYESSVALRPDSPLLRDGLAQAQLASGDPALATAAIDNLRQALRFEPRSVRLWSNIGRAYAADGQMGMAVLAQAEAAFLRSERTEARFHAGKALKMLPSGSPSWVRAQDILLATQNDDDRAAPRR